MATEEIDDVQPKTFGCHHTAETCRLCHQMVARWKATRVVAKMTAEQTQPLVALFREVGHQIPPGQEHAFVLQRLAYLLSIHTNTPQ